MDKRVKWDEKIGNLVRMAKLIGTYLEVEIEDPGSDGHKETCEKLKDAYEEFCQWRHDEPYLVDEIKSLLSPHGFYAASGLVTLDVPPGLYFIES